MSKEGKSIEIGGRTWRVSEESLAVARELLRAVTPSEEHVPVGEPLGWDDLEGMRVSLGSWELELRVARYRNGRTAIHAFTPEGEPEHAVTVNLVDEPLGPNQIFVPRKGNAPEVALALEREGVLRRTGEWASSGYVEHYADKWELAS